MKINDKNKWIIIIPVITGIVVAISLAVVSVAVIAICRSTDGKKYTKEDAQKLADRVSADNTYIEENEAHKIWYFRDNKYEFNFIIKEEKLYPPGLPPKKILQTDYYCRRFERTMQQYDNVILYEKKNDDGYTMHGKTTPAEYKTGRYECVCFSEEDLIEAVSAINQAVIDICQEDNLDGLSCDNYESIIIIYKLNDTDYVDLLYKGNTNPDDILNYIHKQKSQ